MKNMFPVIFLIFTCLGISAQEISETNTDVIYLKALEEYKSGDFRESLRYSRHGLELAPNYHDIRILQVRNLWALENFEQADEDLEYLLAHAPEYIDVKPLALQRVDRAPSTTEALEYLSRVEEFYSGENSLQILKTRLLLKSDKKKEARALATELISSPDLTGEQRYGLQLILNRTVTDEIGVSYQRISFSEDYSRNDSWNNGNIEYLHNFNRTAIIGRVSYTDRAYDQSLLYELEAYPVFSDRFYAYTNIGLSEGSLFPDLRSSISLYYNFGKVFEGEIGGRLLNFENQSYFTGIFGLSLYQGRFLFNARSFLGPQRQGKLVRNYQGNIRYYLNQADNYLFARVGSGISPDERINYTQIQENPALQTFYSSLGIRHLFWSRHIFQVEGGMLFQDITSERKGSQLQFSLGYRIRL